MNLYFERAHNQPYSFFHEESFRRHLELKSLPEFLLFAVLASAVRFSSDPYFGEFKSEALRGYASESWKLIVAVCFGPESDPNIFYCQAVTLLSIIDFTGTGHHSLNIDCVRSNMNPSRQTPSRLAQDRLINPYRPRLAADDGTKSRSKPCRTRGKAKSFLVNLCTRQALLMRPR